MPTTESQFQRPMQLSIPQSNILGECLLWHGGQSAWWWTDIESRRIYCSSMDAHVRSFDMPDRVGSFVHCRSGRLVLGTTKALFSFDIRRGVSQLLCPVESDEARTRINDGRTDRQGNYVFGSFDQSDEKSPIAHFYQYSQQYGLRRLGLPGVAIANSICFSLDGNTMYFTDTGSRQIMQCDYDAERAIVSHIRLFTETESSAYPDGSVIDREACLWNAQWGAGQVVRYAPDGRELQRITVPVKNPTCPALGGANLDVLMVTSSRKDMTDQELQAMPDAGALFSIQLGQSLGVADALFEDV